MDFCYGGLVSGFSDGEYGVIEFDDMIRDEVVSQLARYG